MVEKEIVRERINLLDRMIWMVTDLYIKALELQRFDICDEIINIVEGFIIQRLPEAFEKFLNEEIEIQGIKYKVKDIRTNPILREKYRPIAINFLIQCLDILKRQRKSFELKI